MAKSYLNVKLDDILGRKTVTSVVWASWFVRRGIISLMQRRGEIDRQSGCDDDELDLDDGNRYQWDTHGCDLESDRNNSQFNSVEMF